MSERSHRGNTKSDPGSLVTGLAARLGDLEKAVGRQAERFAALIDIGTQISAAQNTDHLLKAVMERLTALVGAQAASLFMYDERKDELWSRVLKAETLAEIRIAAKSGIAGHVFTTGRTLHLGDAYADPRFNPEIDRKSGFQTRSIVASPLKHVSGKVLGVLEVLDSRIDAFSADDRAMVEGVASQIAAVLENVFLLEELQSRNDALKRASEELARRVHDLDVLYDVEKAISMADARVDLLDRILLKAIEVVQAGAGSVLLAEEDEGDALYFRSARGERSEALTSMRLKARRGIAGHVAASGDIVRVERAEDCEYYDRSVARKLGVTVGALLCVPIHAEGRTLGALELLNKKGGFTDADERLTVLLAGQVGRALVVRQSREEFERKARLASIGQMISGVMHDLRTPLTVISGYAEMMGQEDDEKARGEMTKAILSQVDHVSSMQRETLAFARGERSILVRKVYLQDFVKELAELLKKEFEASPVELKVNAPYTGPARFDEGKLKRAIFNLARNALEAMPEGGRFSLSIEREGPELLFRAQDNGPGIPEDIAGRLFESFVTSGKVNGTGLGLAIVKRIAQEHGGTVGFKTRAGKGTTFELRIPAGAPDR